MLRQACAGMSAMALTITAIVPLYCLLTTPSDVVAIYGIVHRENFGSELPSPLLAVGAISKLLYVTVWLTCMTAQMGVCFFLRPRLWINLTQLMAAILVVGLFGGWHVCVLSSMRVLFSDLAVLPWEFQPD